MEIRVGDNNCIVILILKGMHSILHPFYFKAKNTFEINEIIQYPNQIFRANQQGQREKL